MRSRRLSEWLCLAASWLLLSATAARAQVDWSDLFPEEGHKPAPKAAREPQQIQPAPAPVQPAVRPAERAPAVARPRPVARPQRPAAKHNIARTKRAQREVPRRVTDEDGRSEPQYDREFLEPLSGSRARPAARTQQAAEPQPDGAAPQAEAEPAPAPARPVVSVPRPAPVAPKRVAAEPPPVVAKPAAPVAESAPAADGNSVEQPAAHKPVHAAAAEANGFPEADGAGMMNRARKAAAAQAARSDEHANSAPGEDGTALGGTQADADAQLARADHGTVADGNGALASAGLEAGEVITDKNLDKYKHLLSPGLEWALRYGWRIKVGAPRPIGMIRPYRDATEKYSGQVKLAPDGMRLMNWTAGQPFPKIDPNDPQVAVKIMWNYSYSSAITDDMNSENFDADTGTIGKNRGMVVERHYLIDNLRRLNYTGRLFVEPKPELPNPDGVRYKESIHPLSEPFDLKGVGGTFYRYIDPDRQDDSWLYLPQLRRVRRLSTAQRSDALFGQDSDVDSYYGYNGHIAWMDWKFLGERTILAAMHGQHAPVKWQEPEDWAFDDVWEPREVYVVEGTSKLPQYAYGKRVLFIDKQGWVVTHSDIYDRAGQLWKVWINLRSYKKEAIPGAKISRYPEEMSFTHAIVMLDTQLVHATRAALPSTHTPDSECIFLNMGAKSGTKEDFFSVANLIESGH